MRKRTILIVDDQAINRKILNKILVNDYEVIEASNGKDALEILNNKAEEISAVILDIVMPVMDGYSLLKKMKKDNALARIPVIVSSQMGKEEDEVKALTLGAQDFIAKPYRADIIIHRLSNTIALRETSAVINSVERDEVTGLYNKEFFYQKVKKQLSMNDDDYDLFCFGIERHQLISDTYGTKTYEEMIKYIANIFNNYHLSLDIAMYQDNLFYILSKHKEKFTNSTFKKLYKQINQFPIEMEIKMYCGIYQITDHSIAVGVMCTRAQLAANRNIASYNESYFMYDDSIRDKLLQEQFITTNMVSALEQGQFEVYYQPKYEIVKEDVAGAEALVRWNHPEKGLIYPGDFIPIFENNGFIMRLDQYVWEKVCIDINKWIKEKKQLVSVSINVSRADLYNPRLIDILTGLVKKYQIPIDLLHLEITESAYTDNPDQIIIVVNKLREFGFIIEMDDFGSGYSSLNMLASMPVDVLKLDMRFIQTEQQNKSGRGILNFIISLAKWMNLSVVAEGVESKDQVEVLRSMNCNYVQGYYYAKPMQKHSFEELISNTKPVKMQIGNLSLIEEEEIEEVEKKDSVMLIVDDMEVNQEVLAGIFEKEYQIVKKADGKQALEYIENTEDEIAIILLDLLMPEMDGFQLLSKLKSNDSFKDIPVVVTSQPNSDYEQRVLELKADDYITKPFNRNIIRHRVHGVLALHELKNFRGAISEQTVKEKMQYLSQFFDTVRLVNPQSNIVYGAECEDKCYDLWHRSKRCRNCTSLRAFNQKTRMSKLEFNSDKLFYVQSIYVNYENGGAIIETLNRLDDHYTEYIYDHSLLLDSLDDIHSQLDHDVLTGIFNRRYLDRQLENYVNDCSMHHRNLAVAMIDVDHFKKWNDAYGHLFGDEVIKQVAQTLENNIAISKGDFVARFGGDEFIIVCKNIPQQVFIERMEKISNIISDIRYPGKKVQLAISIGIAFLGQSPQAKGKDLIDKADKRLYCAKAKGRDKIICSDN